MARLLEIPQALQADRLELDAIAGQLAPPAEQRLRSIMRSARYELVTVSVGQGIYQVTAEEFEAIAERLGLNV